MRILRALGATTLFLLLSVGAEATVLTTPAVRIFSSQGLLCHLLNLTSKERTVTIEILNAPDGMQLYKNETTVAPGAFAAVTRGGPNDELLYCRFTVDAPKGKVRGAIANETTGLGFPAQ
jgi:hypothetical protein